MSALDEYLNKEAGTIPVNSEMYLKALQHLTQRMEEVRIEKEKCVKNKTFEQAAALRDVERRLKKEIENLEMFNKAAEFAAEKDYAAKKESEVKKEKAHGLRYNDGKLKWSYVHWKSLEPMVRVLMYGAQKYEPFNWQKGLNRVEVLESMARHLTRLMDGEVNDAESGLSHIGHILCNAMFFQYMIDEGKGV